ncbi:uncharacterized protein LOC135088366 [Ostrinia nubilalis]|uniref:uncharacterized protein LOC114366119 n=1 Tax=Ostrinia furnacalis TaxID=93504 RepID=UPI0010398CE0|nr:uncharacterized protein LOC114366119 [Ostrinia furnacalis]
MKVYSVVGNKKKVTMETNGSLLKVVGNNCIVRVSCNHGEIEVIGNDCSVEVRDNYGTIQLVGGNGIVTIVNRWDGDRVQLVGPTNHLTVAGKRKGVPSYEAQLSPFSKNLDDVIESLFTFVMR